MNYKIDIQALASYIRHHDVAYQDNKGYYNISYGEDDGCAIFFASKISSMKEVTVVDRNDMLSTPYRRLAESAALNDLLILAEPFLFRFSEEEARHFLIDG